MTVPAAPLPAFANLIKALTAPQSTGERWTKDSAYVARFYRRGSFALAAGIEAARKAANASTATVWVPDYFCNEALEPARRNSVELRFYAVDENLAPNFEKLRAQAQRKAELQLLLLVHYFGFPNATNEARKFCDTHGMILVEDAAHMLSPGVGSGLGELVVFSPRKVLALPSGGLLLSSSELNHLVGQPAGETDWLETLGWAGRRLTQSILAKIHFPWHRLKNYDQVGPDTDACVAGEHEREAYNSYALRLLDVTESEFDKVLAQRRANYVRLLQWVNGQTQIRPLFARLIEGVCPYAFPLIVERGCEDVVIKLKAAGVMASRWPDLPPEVSQQQASHEIAVRTYEQLALLPIHQSLKLKDIDSIGRTLQAILG